MMTHEEILLYLSDLIIKKARMRLPFPFYEYIKELRIKIQTENQEVHKIIFHISDRTVWEFMVDEDFIDNVHGNIDFELTHFGREIKMAGGIQEYRRERKAITDKEEAEKKLLEEQQKLSVDAQVALKKYQRWIVYATLATALYYALEVLKYFHFLPSTIHYCHF